MANEGSGAGTEILKVLARLEAKIDRLVAGGGGGNGGGKVAPDHDLDGSHGNPSIRRDPPRWKGEGSFSGMTMNQAPADYLDVLGEFLDWKADRDEEEMDDPALSEEDKKKKERYVHFGRLDAARARGWAQRKRNGWKPPERNPKGWD